MLNKAGLLFTRDKSSVPRRTLREAGCAFRKTHKKVFLIEQLRICCAVGQKKKKKRRKKSKADIFKKNNKLRDCQFRNAADFPPPQMSRGVSVWHTVSLLKVAYGGVNKDTECNVRKNLNTFSLQPRSFKTAALLLGAQYTLCRTAVLWVHWELQD